MATDSTPNNGQRRATRYAALPMRDHDGWRIRWIDADGKRRSRNFPANAYQEAVAELERIKGEMRAIKDGRAPKPRRVPTFGAFVEQYWTPNRTLNKRSPKDDHSMLRKHLLPAFSGTALTHITTERVERLKGDLAALGLKPKTVHNVLTLLVSILRYAADLDFVSRLPKVRKPRLQRQDYQYLKTDRQIEAFLRAAKHKGPLAHAFFSTAVYTGMRAGELFGLRWSDVDFPRRLITVQRSFDKPTKTGEVRHVPIVDVLLPILEQWRLTNSNKLVFPNEAGNMHAPNPRLVKYAHRFRVTAGKHKGKTKEVKGTFGEVLDAAGLPRLRFHDLRHTFASHFVMRGGDPFILQKILGHASQAMTARYSHLAPEAFDAVRALFGTKPPATGEGEVIDAAKARRRRKG